MFYGSCTAHNNVSTSIFIFLILSNQSHWQSSFFVYNALRQHQTAVTSTRAEICYEYSCGNFRKTRNLAVFQLIKSFSDRIGETNSSPSLETPQAFVKWTIWTIWKQTTQITSSSKAREQGLLKYNLLCSSAHPLSVYLHSLPPQNRHLSPLPWLTTHMHAHTHKVWTFILYSNMHGQCFQIFKWRKQIYEEEAEKNEVILVSQTETELDVVVDPPKTKILTTWLQSDRMRKSNTCDLWPVTLWIQLNVSGKKRGIWGKHIMEKNGFEVLFE